MGGHDMGRADAVARLRRAATEIEQAIEMLNVAEAPCAACGSRHFMAPVEAKVFEALAKTPTRLRENANKLELGLKYNSEPTTQRGVR